MACKLSNEVLFVTSFEGASSWCTVLSDRFAHSWNLEQSGVRVHHAEALVYVCLYHLRAVVHRERERERERESTLDSFV